MNYRAEATLNLSALEHNLRVVRQHAPQQSILAMIKANAYGHGIERAAQALMAVDAFGVACLEEALALRAANIKKEIVLVEGVFSVKELKRAAAEQLQMVVHHDEQIQMLRKTPLQKPVKIWLKIDTGMHRLGFAAEKAFSAYEALLNIATVERDILLMTHLADADDRAKATTIKQLTTFQTVTATMAGLKSIANSAGILAWPAARADWVRPGIMLYGCSPFAEQRGADFNLRPVMTLSAQIITIHQLQAGDAVGYGGIGVCPEDMPVAVVSIGYGDGYPRHARNGTPVLIQGKRCPLLGRVSMDMITVDLRPCPEAKIGDRVILWGEGLPAEEVAAWADTISYTLFCGVTQRVKYSQVPSHE